MLLIRVSLDKEDRIKIVQLINRHKAYFMANEVLELRLATSAATPPKNFCFEL